MNIEQNIARYLSGDAESGGLKPAERYASFDYCYNYFQSFREQGRIADIAAPAYLQTLSGSFISYRIYSHVPTSIEAFDESYGGHMRFPSQYPQILCAYFLKRPLRCDIA